MCNCWHFTTHTYEVTVCTPCDQLKRNYICTSRVTCNAKFHSHYFCFLKGKNCVPCVVVPQQAPPGAKQVGSPAPVKKTLPLASQSSPKPAVAKPAPPRPVTPPQPPPPPPEVCLRWNSYHSNMQATFPSLLNNEQFVDVTLACEGRSIKCHKVSTQSAPPACDVCLTP